MAKSNTRRMKVEERRAQLLQLGRQIFSEHAFDEISTDELARIAGISKGLLYHYFDNKRGFYVGTIAAAAAELNAVLQLDPELDPLAGLAASHTAFLDWIEQNRSIYLAVMRSGIGSDPECRRIIEGIHGGILSRMLSALGVAGDPAPRLRARLMGWIGFSEFLSLDWLETRELSRDEVLGLILEAWRPIVLEELPGSAMAGRLRIPVP